MTSTGCCVGRPADCRADCALVADSIISADYGVTEKKFCQDEKKRQKARDLSKVIRGPDR